MQEKYEAGSAKARQQARKHKPKNKVELKQVPKGTWTTLSAKLPYKKTEEDKKRRKTMFRSFDPNGNGLLSLAEVDLGIKSVLRCEALFDVKPVLIRAFNAAKNKSGTDTGPKADYIEFGEFRILLWYLRQYFEYWVMFDRLDTSDDRKLSFDEFQATLGEIKKWGVEVTDARATFAEIDEDGHGMVLFDEFCNWAIAKQLDLEDDEDDEENAVELKVIFHAPTKQRTE